MSSLRQDPPFPFLALLGASAIVLACVTGISLDHSVALEAYFGNVPPVLAAILVCSVGTAALYVLHTRLSFFVYVPGTSRRGWLAAVVLAFPFMLSIALIDTLFRFPMDINVPLPTALIFYLAMGYVAQMALHVAPLAVLLSIGNVLFSSGTGRQLIWISFVLVATLETVFQVRVSLAGGDPAALTAFVAAHLFLFGLVELWLFRRFDYVSMYLFRMVYYGFWHLTWGTLRLQWLF